LLRTSSIALEEQHLFSHYAKHLLTLNHIVFPKKNKDSAKNLITHTRQATVPKWRTRRTSLTGSPKPHAESFYEQPSTGRRQPRFSFKNYNCPETTAHSQSADANLQDITPAPTNSVLKSPVGCTEFVTTHKEMCNCTESYQQRIISEWVFD